MDPEESDSGVSVIGSDALFTGNPAEPALPGPSKQPLESADAIDARLRELSHVEDSNIRKQKSLREKRRRKDERVQQRRDVQDRKWRTVLDARDRHEQRTKRRRDDEDLRYRAAEEQIEQEETALRRRLKRLKRGLPLDDSPLQGGRSVSHASMSPPGPAFSTIPPPAKRHQSRPPNHNEGSLPPHHVGLPPPTTSAAPSYSFYQGDRKPHNVPYHPGNSYSTLPPPSGPTPATLISHHSSSDRSAFAPINGRPASPLPKPPTLGSTPSHETSTRRTPSAYDTRPPPPTSSGFATINAPQHSGFAAVNSRSAATPPSAYSAIPRPTPDNNTPNAAFPDAAPDLIRHESNGKDSNSSTTAAGGKRTPSTTHPYQMSEAFANRHHHCERTDGLNRGIWTYHGPNLGTAEHPTGPPVEMYLRCNHEDCRRIDWRTVHGLQCHIVKNHEQPKGTIGSLEKALDRYGVPVSEVEEYEREHGEGTGGTMADPKNLKLKNRLSSARKATPMGPSPGSWGLDANARPAGYKPSPGEGRMVMDKDMGDFVSRRSAGYVEDVNAYPGSEPRKGGFEAVRGWKDETPTRPQQPIDRQLQGDAVMRDSDSSDERKENGPEVKGFTAMNSKPTPPARFVSVQQPAQMRSKELAPPMQSPRQDQRAPQPAVIQGSSQAALRDAQDWQMNKIIRVNAPTAEQLVSPLPSNWTPGDMVHPDAVPPEAFPAAIPATTLNTETKSIERPKTPPPPPAPTPVPQAEAPKPDPEPEFKEPPTPTTDGPRRGTRSALQSPVITQKPLPTPGSAKRSGRRSSYARKPSQDTTSYAKVDGDGDSHMDDVDASTRGEGSAKREGSIKGGVSMKGEGNTKGEGSKGEEESTIGEGKAKGIGDVNVTAAGNAEDVKDGESITVAATRGRRNTVTKVAKEKDGLGINVREEVEEMITPPRRAASGRFTARKRTGR